MRSFGSIRVLCTLALLAGAAALKAQTSNPTPATDPAITALSVMGVVSDLKPDTRQVIVTTAAGSQVTVTLSDRTVYMRIPPGERPKTSSSRSRRLTSAWATASLLAAG